jgi:DNA polymerase-3 subunit gamma/tau
MAALYRIYRPKRFSEVVGQGHIVQTLRNAVIKGQPAHAYLFCGGRGLGKTTLARVLARALNCLEIGLNGEAASTSTKSKKLPASISRHTLQRMQASPFNPISKQFKARASTRARVVLPRPRPPQKR